MVTAAALVMAAPFASAHAVWMPEMPELPDPTRAHEPVAYADVADGWAGAEVGGVLLLTGTAWAQRGYAAEHVAIWVDGRFTGIAEGVESWSYALDTRRLMDGPHEVAAYAMATASAAPAAAPLVGSGEKIRIETLNHLRGEPLHVATYEMTGAEPESWTLVLRKDYASLRVIVETEPGTRPEAVPRGEILVSYVGPADAKSWTPDRAWVATFGAAHGSLVVSRETDVEMQAGGVLALGGAFAGDGRVTLRVEALPAAA